jgi:hypothetical protein
MSVSGRPGKKRKELKRLEKISILGAIGILTLLMSAALAFDEAKDMVQLKGR